MGGQETVKFCKDCSHHSIKNIGDGWVDTIPTPVCGAVKRYNLVSGNPYYFVTCASAREKECGSEALLFAHRPTQEAE